MRTKIIIAFIAIFTFFTNAFAQESKTYLKLSPAQQTEFVSQKLFELKIIKDNNLKVPDPIFTQIKSFVDGYARRITPKKSTKCSFGNDLTTVFNRAVANAPAIIRSFEKEKVDPVIGLYIAMIETEHCACMQTPTGLLGLFQLDDVDASNLGLEVDRYASPKEPDERCNVEKSAQAVAKKIKSLLDSTDFKTDDPLFAIAFNNNPFTMFYETSNDIWEKPLGDPSLLRTYQKERVRYLTKFLAAAIVGENPQHFGLKIKPLSSYKN